MLYPKKQEKELSAELFKMPTAEYRAVPFWAWNCELNFEIMTEQIGYFKEMGFGGFHMHSRSGMSTEYLSEKFGEIVCFCVKEAEKHLMSAWLYDEDRWPSGSAGGLVTKNLKYRARMLELRTVFTESVSYQEAVDSGKPYLAACYDICLDENNNLISYQQIQHQDKPKGTKWYAYV